MAYTKGYAKVDERLRAAQEHILSIDVDRPQMLNDVCGFVRVKVTFYPTERGERFGVGVARFRLDYEDWRLENGKPHPVSFKAKAVAPIETAETVALGRALAKLGYYEDGTIASDEEIDVVRE